MLYVLHQIYLILTILSIYSSRHIVRSSIFVYLVHNCIMIHRNPYKTNQPGLGYKLANEGINKSSSFLNWIQLSFPLIENIYDKINWRFYMLWQIINNKKLSATSFISQLIDEMSWKWAVGAQLKERMKRLISSTFKV